MVVTDNPLYKNKFINDLVKEDLDNQIKIIVELDFKHPKASSSLHYKRYFQLLGPIGIIYLGFLTVINTIKLFFSSILPFSNGYSLKQICKKNKLIYKKINDVNGQKFLNVMENYKIDYILNSGNQIFRKKIIDKMGNKILNRHSALLPSYGGIYPIFWQMLKNEKYGGVTLHWIDESIDEGIIAYQKKMIIDLNNSLFDHYEVAFEISLELCKKFLFDVQNGNVRSMDIKYKKSYYSWPKKEDIKQFKKLRLKIV